MIVRNLLVTAGMGACAFFNAQQVMYFDENWEATTKDKMVYYRHAEQKGNHTLIKDFYKSGVMQMQGLASDSTPGAEVFDGEVTWYYDNGKVENMVTFKDGERVGPAKNYDDKGRLLSDMVYFSDGDYTGKLMTFEDPEWPLSNNSYTEYKNGVVMKEVAYDKSMTTGTRYEIDYKNGYEHYVAKYYDANNKLIATNEYKNGKNKGDIAEYYAQPMQLLSIKKYGKDDTVTDEKYFYRNGTLAKEVSKKEKSGKETTYDSKGNVSGKLDYKFTDGYLAPDQGKEVNFAYGSTNIVSEIDYANGLITKDRYYNDETFKLVRENYYDAEYATYNKSIFYDPKTGAKRGELTYQDGLPYNGIFYDDFSTAEYKDGKMQKSKSYNFDKDLVAERVLSNDGKTYQGKILDLNDGKVVMTYVSDAESDTFDAKVSQLEKGKVVRTATIKNGIFVDGQIVLLSSDGKIEYVRKGDWRYLRTFNAEGKMIEESKKLFSDDVYDSNAFYISEDYFLNMMY